MRCEGGALHEKSCFPENSSKRIGVRRQILNDGASTCESTGRTNPGRGANREAKGEETDCGSGKVLGVIILVLGE